MSIGNLKDYGNKGNNFPWQLKMLQGQQCACDYLKEIDLNTDLVEPLLVQILTAIQNGTDYEAMLVVDNAGLTWLEIRIWNGTTFDPPVYYLAGSNIPGVPTAPITYINPNSYLAQIVSNTTGLATELTLGDIKTSVQLIDNCVGVDGTAAPTNSFLVAGVTASGVQQTIEVNASGHVNIADGGGSITVDATSLPLPTGASTEATLLLVNNNLSSASRTPNIRTYVNAVGSTTAGIYSFSIANVGSAAGTVDSQTLPAGVTVNFDGGAMNNTLGAMSFDATGTTFVVTWIS